MAVSAFQLSHTDRNRESLLDVKCKLEKHPASPPFGGRGQPPAVVQRCMLMVSYSTGFDKHKGYFRKTARIWGGFALQGAEVGLY